MNSHYKVTSRPITKNIITLEMDEAIANEITTAIGYYLLNYKSNLSGGIYPELEEVKNSIKGHL